jgi:N-methylhydantoinase A/oxoprolinase/acetone carboxylase beta subunit
MLTFRSGLLAAGPESAGAQPGPACYRKGGPLTVTDANLLLGNYTPYTLVIRLKMELILGVFVYGQQHITLTYIHTTHALSPKG